MLKGNVESRFVYATLLSGDLLPFGHFGYRPVVLPIEPAGGSYDLLTAHDARKKGYVHLAQWLEEAQEEWDDRRGAKASKMDIYERLDRVHGLTAQNPQARYQVLYPASATYVCACVLERETVQFGVDGQEVRAAGVAIDHKSYHYEADGKPEASYLAAVLNSPTVDGLVKPMQSRGQYGARDIHKKVLELPIPRFDASEETHSGSQRSAVSAGRRLATGFRATDQAT